MSKNCIIMTSFRYKSDCDRTLSILFKEKLIASTKIMNVRSSYFRKGKICDESEIMVLMGTTNELYKTLKKRILDLVSYDEPEIVKIEVDDDSMLRMSWLYDAPEIAKNN